MASDDVLERAESWLGSFCQGLTHKLERTDRLVSALAAEVRELRAKLDSEASHRLSLCADNERFVAEIERLRDREVEIVAARARDYREFSQAQSEIERLREDLVWAVTEGVGLFAERGKTWLEWTQDDRVHVHQTEDGTPESICRAVREARDGVR